MDAVYNEYDKGGPGSLNRFLARLPYHAFDGGHRPCSYEVRVDSNELIFSCEYPYE